MKRNILGGLTILLVSSIVYFFNMYVVDIPKFEWITYFGIGIFILGFIYLAYEVRKNLPFIYGRSQHGGSNANSYVVIGLGLGLVCRNLNTIYFVLSIIVAIVLSLAVYRFLPKR